MKWLVRIVLVLVVLLVVADFGARILVENLAGRALASRRGFNGDVDVGFDGFPFLLNLKDRHFEGVTVSAEDVRSSGLAEDVVLGPGSEVQLDEVTVEMRDVSIAGDLWGDDPDRKIAAAGGSGTAVMGGAALNRLVPEEYDLRLTLLESRVRVTGTIPPAGEQSVEVPAGQVRLEGSALVVEAPAPVGAITIPIPELVDGMTLESVGISRGRIDFTFSVRGLRLSL